jgi:adrenodoxin-NADP+ reductase
VIELIADRHLFQQTDITEQSLEKLKSSTISAIHLIGRRGPLQVAFTIKEFREQTKIPDCQTLIDPNDFSGLTSEYLVSISQFICC